MLAVIRVGLNIQASGMSGRVGVGVSARVNMYAYVLVWSFV